MLGGFILYIIIMAPAILFMLYAQAKVKSTYKKYSEIPNMRRLTGAQAAEVLLKANRLDDVAIEGIRGHLTDHYDPRKKVLRLSEEVYTKPSVASLGIVAHEVGHAVQDRVGYAPMKMRAFLVPAANLGTNLGWVFVFVGVILAMLAGNSDIGFQVALVGLVLFSAAVLFALVTLPVEYNASRRARQMLDSNGLVVGDESKASTAVLSAAALTYVGALLSAVATLLYFALMVFGLRR